MCIVLIFPMESCTSSKYQSARVQCNWKLPRVVRVATAVLNENATLAGRVWGCSVSAWVSRVCSLLVSYNHICALCGFRELTTCLLAAGLGE